MNSGPGNVDERVAPLIDGALSQSESDVTVEVTNPSNGRRCLSIPAGAEGDANRAVGSARRAFETGEWSEAPPSLRKRVLHRLAELIEQHGVALDCLDA